MEAFMNCTHVCFLLIVVVAHGLGAGLPAPAPRSNALAGTAADEGLSSIHFALTAVPAQVNCVRLNGQSDGRTVQVKASVTPGASAPVTFAGLRPGSWVLDLEAFPQACPNVSATTLSTWASATATVTLGPGQTDLGFVLRPVAEVKGSIDFVTLTLTGPGNFSTPAPGSQSLPFTIKNVGKTTSQIAVTVVGGVGTIFTATAPCLTLRANETCTGTVTFQVPIPGSWFAQLSVAGSPGGTVTAPLSGVGTGIIGP
jgi:hypothetical protein